jgi:signal transduction histidine kinase
MTLRVRLTLLYGACFLAAGVALLAITYGLVRAQSGGNTAFVARAPGFGATESSRVLGPLPTPAAGPAVFLSTQPQRSGPPVQRAVRLPAGTTVGFEISAYGRHVRALDAATLQRITSGQRHQIDAIKQQANVALGMQRSQQLASLLTKSGVALAIMAFLSIGLGWVVAGRALRPLRTMNARARRITEHNLDERLAVEPRSDELGELAQTFDQVLARLERAFESQRRFVANASHELRTPVTVERALIEVALADPDASVESLRECCERVLATGEQQERLIEALLTLARSQGGIEAREAVDLEDIAGELVAQRQEEGAAVAIEATLAPATTRGDRALIERLAANLLDNAIAYNVADGGWVRVSTGAQAGRPTLRVSNSGRAVPEAQVPELFEPFRRLNGERLNGSRGLGLGLSIVDAIATAHGAALYARPRREGGLEVQVSFPPA